MACTLFVTKLHLPPSLYHYFTKKSNTACHTAEAFSHKIQKSTEEWSDISFQFYFNNCLKTLSWISFSQYIICNTFEPMNGLKWVTTTRDSHLTGTERKTCLKGTQRALPSVQLSWQTISSESRRNRPAKYRDITAKQPTYVLTRSCDQFRSPNNAVRISLGKGWTT